MVTEQKKPNNRIHYGSRKFLSYRIFKIAFSTSYANSKNISKTNVLYDKNSNNDNKKIISLDETLETWVQSLTMLWIANHNVTLAATFNCCVLRFMIFKKGDNIISLSLIFIWLVYSHCKQGRVWDFFSGRNSPSCREVLNLTQTFCY